MRWPVTPALALLAASCALTPLPAPRAAVPPLRVSGVRRVVLIVLENGNPERAAAEPYLRDRASEGMVLARYFAVAHPSQPNYIAMISGSTAGALTDRPVTLHRPHIGQALGDRWRVYAEDYPALPGRCNLVRSRGLYVRRHVPFLSFADVQSGTCAQIVPDPIGALRRDIEQQTLPDFALIIPNLEHDGHEPYTLDDANAWLTSSLGPLLADPRLATGTVFILTFDEDDTRRSHGNRVFTVLWGEHVQHGTRDDVYDHEDLLATIAALLGVAPPPFDESNVRPFGGIWR
jgi:phosphatidylinositol-3-phosphatase